ARRGDRRAASRPRRNGGGEPHRPGPHHRGDLRALHPGPSLPPAGPVRTADNMTAFTQKEWRAIGISAALLAIAALLPFLDQGFYLSLSLNIVMYMVLCTAWTLFSGPTHYISLATAAFFGVGTYATALGINVLPFPLLVLIGAGGAAALAALV